jgi:hypothetical protein
MEGTGIKLAVGGVTSCYFRPTAHKIDQLQVPILSTFLGVGLLFLGAEIKPYCFAKKATLLCAHSS